MPAIFDPRSEDLKIVAEVGDEIAFEKHCAQLCTEVAEARRGDRRGAVVCVVHRNTHDVRWFDLGPRAKIRLEDAGQLLRGRYRFATDEEEQAARKAQREHAEAKARKHLAVKEHAVKMLSDDAQFSHDVELLKGKAGAEKPSAEAQLAAENAALKEQLAKLKAKPPKAETPKPEGAKPPKPEAKK